MIILTTSLRLLQIYFLSHQWIEKKQRHMYLRITSNLVRCQNRLLVRRLHRRPGPAQADHSGKSPIFIPKPKWFESFPLAPVLVDGVAKLRLPGHAYPLRGSLTQTTSWFVLRKRSFMPCWQAHGLRINFPKPPRFGYSGRITTKIERTSHENQGLSTPIAMFNLNRLLNLSRRL